MCGGCVFFVLALSHSGQGRVVVRMALFNAFLYVQALMVARVPGLLKKCPFLL